MNNFLINLKKKQIIDENNLNVLNFYVYIEFRNCDKSNLTFRKQIILKYVAYYCFYILFI
jgi:hypothetical protein